MLVLMGHRLICLIHNTMFIHTCNFCRKEYKNAKRIRKFCSKICSSKNQIWTKRKSHTEEFKMMVSLRHKWKVNSDSTKEKIRLSKLWTKNPLFGKKRTIESRIKQWNSTRWSKSCSWKWGLPKCIDCNKELTNYKSIRCMWCVGKHRSWIKSPSWRWWISKINKTERQLAMETKEYKFWRKSVFERDNYSCVHCWLRWWKMQADHIKRWSEFPELRYDIDNWRTLCLDCHIKTPTWWWRKMFPILNN